MSHQPQHVRCVLVVLTALCALLPRAATAGLAREPTGQLATTDSAAVPRSIDHHPSLRRMAPLGSTTRRPKSHQGNHGALFQKAEAFSYARNNPVNFIDPTGLESVGAFLFRKAGEASDAGNTLSAFALGAAYTAWQTFGMEAVSSLEDKRIHGQDISAGDVGMAALEVGTLGKGGGVVGAGAKLLRKAGAKSIAHVAPRLGGQAAKNTANLAKLGKQLGSESGVAELLGGGGRAIAGAGTKKPIRDVARVVAEHGGEAADWAKVSSKAQGGVEIHAYRDVVRNMVVEFKSIIP